MAEITLTVTGEGTHTDWTKVGALGIADTMNSDDDATSYYNNDGETGLNDMESFDFDDMPGFAAQITTHKAYFTAAKRSGNNKTVVPAAYLGAFGAGASQALNDVGVWLAFDRTDMQTGTPTIVQMDAGELRLQHTGGNVGDVGWSYTYWEITFVPSGGGCNWLMSEWIPPLIGLCSGAGLMFSEIYKELKAVQFINMPRSIKESIKRHSAGEKKVMRTLPSSRQEFELIKNELLIRRQYCFMER